MTNEELVRLIQRGIDRKANMGQLYKQNYGLISKIAEKYSQYEDMADLLQEAYFGLASAAECWKPDGGANFATYAFFWLRQSMRSYVNNCGAVIRLPAHRKDRVSQYKKFIADFQREFSREPSAAEIISGLRIKAEQLETVKKDARALEIKSLDAEILNAEGDSCTLGDLIDDDRDEYAEVDDAIQREQLAAVLWGVVDTLDDRAQVVIRDRYQRGYTRKQCSEKLGVSPAAINQTEKKAFQEMRKPKNRRKLEPFLDDRAHTLGMRGTSLTAFNRTWTSSTEKAVILLEEYEKRRFWDSRQGDEHTTEQSPKNVK